MRKTLLVKLPTIETKDKEPDSAFQSQGATRETTRSSSEASKIVAQLSIVSFYRIGVSLAFGNFIAAEVIPEPLIGIKSIAVVPLCFGRQIDDLLDGLLGAYPNHSPAQNTAGFAIDNRQNIDFVFLSPINVKISSISASRTSSGMGAFGKASATSVTQKATVCGATFKCRAIRRRLPPSTYISAARLRILSG